MATQEIASLYELKGRLPIWENWVGDVLHFLETGNKDRAVNHLKAIKESMAKTNSHLEQSEGK